ncbi:Putative lipoprotein [Providencia alcalifaciens]|nr:Putative lipoprotein [Providencia alcalifaciens]
MTILYSACMQWGLMHGHWQITTITYKTMVSSVLMGHQGMLSVHENCVIYRELPWLQFKQGQV